MIWPILQKKMRPAGLSRPLHTARKLDRAEKVEEWRAPLVRRPALFGKAVLSPAAGAKSPPGDWGGTDDRALRLFQAGRLNDAAVELALDFRDDNFVIAALALRSQVARVTVERIIKTQSASLVIAICWKGGFTMRFALDIQNVPRKFNPRN